MRSWFVHKGITRKSRQHIKIFLFSAAEIIFLSLQKLTHKNQKGYTKNDDNKRHCKQYKYKYEKKLRFSHVWVRMLSGSQDSCLQDWSHSSSIMAIPVRCPAYFGPEKSLIKICTTSLAVAKSHGTSGQGGWENFQQFITGKAEKSNVIWVCQIRTCTDSFVFIVLHFSYSCLMCSCGAWSFRTSLVGSQTQSWSSPNEFWGNSHSLQRKVRQKY